MIWSEEAEVLLKIDGYERFAPSSFLNHTCAYNFGEGNTHRGSLHILIMNGQPKEYILVCEEHVHKYSHKRYE